MGRSFKDIQYDLWYNLEKFGVLPGDIAIAVNAAPGGKVFSYGKRSLVGVNNGCAHKNKSTQLGTNKDLQISNSPILASKITDIISFTPYSTSFPDTYWGLSGVWDTGANKRSYTIYAATDAIYAAISTTGEFFTATFKQAKWTHNITFDNYVLSSVWDGSNAIIYNFGDEKDRNYGGSATGDVYDASSEKPFQIGAHLNSGVRYREAQVNFHHNLILSKILSDAQHKAITEDLDALYKPRPDISYFSISQSQLLPIIGNLSGSVGLTSDMSGKVGVGGGISSVVGEVEMSSAGKEGKSGPLSVLMQDMVQEMNGQQGSIAGLSSVLESLVAALSGKTGVDGVILSVLSNSLFAVGKTGSQGQLNGNVSLTALLFGGDLQGQTIYEGTLAGAAGVLGAQFFGKTGAGGDFAVQVILAASLAGQLGAAGSYTMNLDGVAAMLEGVLGVTGQITVTVSAGADLAAKLGISGEVVAALDNLQLQLIEFIKSEKIYRIILSTQSGRVVFLPPEFGKIEISTLT